MALLTYRFPRTDLWSDAAGLQEKLEKWAGITAQTLEDFDESDTRPAVMKYRVRYRLLEEARALVTEARIKLYTIPS